MRYFLFILIAFSLGAQPLSLRDPMLLGAMRPKAVATPPPSGGLLTGLMAYYKCDDTSSGLLDYSGNGFAAYEYANAPIYEVVGKINTSVGVVNNSDGLLSGVNSSFSQEWSISLWLQSSNSNFGTVYDGSSGEAGDGLLMWWFGDGQVMITVPAGGSYVVGGAINDGGWHHIVATVSSGGEVNLYIDGYTIGTSTGGAITPATGGFLFGLLKRGDTGIEANYDEIGIWNRVLTSSEVTSLYNSNNGLPFGNFTE